MIRYRVSPTTPEVVVQVSGVITAETLADAFSTFADDLRSVPPGFALVLSHPSLVMFEPDALGLLFTLIARLYDADPGLAVFVDGGRGLNPGLRAFIERLDGGGNAHFVRTWEEAERVVSRFADERSSVEAGQRPEPPQN